MVPWSYAEVYKNTTPRYIQQLRHEIVTRRTKQGWTVARICQYYRICRRTVYKWLARFARWGLEGLKDLSRRPKRIAGKIASWVEELIVQIRKSRPYLGPVRIKRQLEQATGYSLAAKTVHNVIARNKEEIDKAKPQKPRRRPKRRRRQTRLLPVDEEWALDIAYQGVKGHGWRKILVILDLGSRRCIDLEQFGEVTGLDVVGQLEKAGRIHGLPRRIRTDNGKQFVCQDLRAFCKKHGLVHTTIRPGHPEQNCVLERFKRTLREECLDLFWFADPQDLKSRLLEYRQHYNVERYHSTLGMTPAQRTAQAKTQAGMAQEAGKERL